MKSLIVDTKHPITLFGGSKVEITTVDLALNLAPNLVVADGGAQTAMALGHKPQAVIGDFDSVDTGSIAQIPPERLYCIPEQDSTDFDKCLRHINAPYILAVGFTGRRLDHELAVYNALTRHPEKRCVVLGEVDLCFLAPPDLHLALPAGTRVSLFPMARCQVTAQGLRWSFKDMDMAPDGKIGTSNEIAEEPMHLQVSEPKLLVILPLTHLKAVIAALT